MKNKTAFLFSILFCTMFILVRVGYAAVPTTSTSFYKDKILIGTDIWPGFIPLYVAQEKGYFKNEGLDVEIRPYQTTQELSNDYVAGKLQGRGSVTLDAVNEAIAGLEHKIILVVDYSNGGDAIVATKKIKSVGDLSGKKVGFEKGSLQDFFLSWALAQKKMNLNNINANHVDNQKAIELLMNGTTDAAVIHEPILSEILTDHRFHVIISSENAPGLITDILTLRTDFIQQHPETVKALLRAYFRGLQFFKDNPKEAYEILANAFKIDEPNTLKKQFEGIHLLDSKENETAFSKSGYYWSIYNNVKIVDNYVRNQLKKSTTVNTMKLIEPKFFKSEED